MNQTTTSQSPAPKANKDSSHAVSEKNPESGKKSKDKKEKRTPLKDENGNEIKRPLSAYMLFNNYRRPVLHNEHTGKFE